MKDFKSVLIATVFMPAAAFAANAVFMSGFEDLPLMPELKQADEAAVSFDTPGGRIVEAYAQGDGVNKRQVAAFYDKTLPQLGWTKANGKTDASCVSYTREGEELTVCVDGADAATVRFELKTTEKD